MSNKNNRGEKPPGEGVEQKETSNKIFGVTIAILIFLFVISVAVFISFFFIQIIWLRWVIVGVMAFLGVCGLAAPFVFKCALSEQIKYFKKYLKRDVEGKCPKPSGYQVLVAVFCILFIASVTVFEAVAIQNAGNDKTTTTISSSSRKKKVKVIINKPTVKSSYDLLSFSDCGSYYFPSEYNSKKFAIKLEESIYKIRDSQVIAVVPDDKLNGSADYGYLANIAVEHDKLLHNIMSGAQLCIKNGPVPKCIYNYMKKNRLAMDSAHITPENSYEIANVYICGIKYGFEENRMLAYENVIKYTWRSFLANYVWGNYTQDDISVLKDRYDELAKINKDREDQIDLIIKALDILKTRL